MANTIHHYKRTTNVNKLVSQLRIKVNPEPRKLKNKEGPPGKFRKLSQIVTGLLKYERIELNFNKADEARGYAERLISEAIRHGDCHTPTMEMADYWIQEKQVIHKLFKVLAPRYQNSSLSYTKLYRAPKVFTQDAYPKSVLELRGNPFPPLVPNPSQNRNLIHNVLLEEARKEYRARKYAEMSEKLASADLMAETSDSKEGSNIQATSKEGTSVQIEEKSAGESASSLAGASGSGDETAKQDEGNLSEAATPKEPSGESKSS